MNSFDQTTDDLMDHLLTIITIIITELLSCFTQPQQQSPNHSPATKVSPAPKKAKSSTSRKSRTTQVGSSKTTKAHIPKTVASSVTPKGSTGSTGTPAKKHQGAAPSTKKARATPTSTKDGTKSQVSKT